ncbi:MAG: orotidine-5'-phosphate decarboxylase [Alphaproteobacteria bacterium CG_4_10_14_0_2_um_filter_63_37]|nr:MAG: orotidine 5'-phosphate decarboxylase [Proteobacteria bacterium CG1_02_64_396]PJA23544.1 MAG: orotidine-5'-phosphate decarboxylase [Alphaproteobacteria bacterium CG_4_10_14_0_2_um_filter_63_37]
MTLPDDRLIVALDTPSYSRAIELARAVAPAAGWVKVGKELFVANGPQIVRDLKALGLKVFLDLKFHDIPNTVAQAVRQAAELGADLTTVHALGGRAMMKAAAQAAQDSGSDLKVVAVTLLTSMGADDAAEVGIGGSPEEIVRRLAQLALDSGLHGVVASGQEAPMLRTLLGQQAWIVTPGIRPLGSAAGDQTRIVTPPQAIEGGASHIVVGRPITGAEDPASAAAAIATSLP